MDNKNINDFFKNILLDKFLVNFIPGLILFYALTNVVSIWVGDGLITLLIVVSTAWTLGVLLEMFVFRKAFYARWQGIAVHTSIDSLNLMFAKMGISIVIACLSMIDLELIIENFDHHPEDSIVAIKAVLFGAAGIFLAWRYWKQGRKNGNN